MEWIGLKRMVSAEYEAGSRLKGSLLIVYSAKVSPDAYIQQALQLAWYRDQGYATATYETASTRGMLHGRTDVIRTLSTESREFIKSMVDDKIDVSRVQSLEVTKHLLRPLRSLPHSQNTSLLFQFYTRHQSLALPLTFPHRPLLDTNSFLPLAKSTRT